MRVPLAIGMILACLVAGAQQIRVQPRQPAQPTARQAAQPTPVPDKWVAADDDDQLTPKPTVDPTPEPEPFEPTIDGPDTARAGRKVVLRIMGSDDLDSVTWVFPATVDSDEFRELSSDSRAAYLWLDAGQYDIAAVVSRAPVKPGMRPLTVPLRYVLELTAPQPPPVVDPVVPPVTPVIPPRPDDVVPVPLSGVRVLFVFESNAKLTSQQTAVLNSTAVNAVLGEVCAKNAAGRAEWRKFDQDIDKRDDLKNESPEWKDLWAKTKAALAKPGASKLPIVAIQRGDIVDMHPLPATIADMIKLLKPAGSK